MSIVLVGGMDRLGEKYRDVARQEGMELHVFSQLERSMAARIRQADAVVIFTNKVSHPARNEAVTAAKKQGVPVFMHHACGLSTLRECLQCLRLSCPHAATCPLRNAQGGVA